MQRPDKHIIPVTPRVARSVLSAGVAIPASPINAMVQVFLPPFGVMKNQWLHVVTAMGSIFPFDAAAQLCLTAIWFDLVLVSNAGLLHTLAREVPMTPGAPTMPTINSGPSLGAEDLWIRFDDFANLAGASDFQIAFRAQVANNSGGPKNAGALVQALFQLYEERQ